MTLRDPAVDAVLTAETIFGQFKALLPRLQSMLPADVTEAVGEAQSLYPELWSALDRARGVLRDRGVDVPDYDDVRVRQPASMLGVNVKLRERSNADVAATVGFLLGGVPGAVVADVASTIGAKEAHANRSGIADARAALDALHKAMPQVQWDKVRRQEAHAAADALEDLAIARNKKIVIGLAVVAVLGLAGFGLIKLMEGSREATPAEKRAQADEAFRAAQVEIAQLNDTLRGNPCDVTAAQRRVFLFQQHDQTRTGKKLAKKFLEECGENTYLRSVADSK